MKNLNIYKRAFALITSASILLLSGCSGNKTETNGTEEKQDCIHFTVYFEDKPVTFKECEGYEISASRSSGVAVYSISNKDGEVIPRGYTNQYNWYLANHNNLDEIIDHPSVQKTK